ncbi:MAG: hypothetical protein OXF88_07680 [Rhodobacteraceae bacterium]|nr:hypothetical protein [Paracoccaceae bacterium]
MADNIYLLIEETAKRDVAGTIYGMVGALADTQAKMITLLLEQGAITSLAAQQMIGELRNKTYPQPPLTDPERVRREAVKWVADHLQECVEWDHATDRAAH